MVPLEEFLPYVKLGKAVGGQGWEMWGGNAVAWLAGILVEKSSLPSSALAWPPFPHITNGKLQRMRTRLLEGQQLNHCRARKQP